MYLWFCPFHFGFSDWTKFLLLPVGFTELLQTIVVKDDCWLHLLLTL